MIWINCTARLALLLILWICSFTTLLGSDCKHLRGEHVCAQHRARQHSMQSPASSAHLEQMTKYDVSFYHLDIGLERTSTFIYGNVLIKAKVIAEQMDLFAFELHQDLTIDSALVNGTNLPVLRTGGEASITLPAVMQRNNELEVRIYYKGTPPSGASAAIGNGMSNAFDRLWNQQVTWSLSQPYSAYEWWPCKQVLTDKADSVYVFVTTSADNKAGSNGLLTATVALPDNKVRYEWKSRYPIAYYLISVAVAQYQEYNFYAKPAGGTDSILVQNYLYNHPEVLPLYQRDIDETAALMDLYSQQFGLYPFWQEKYGHSMAAFGGGMEHQTMTTQGLFVLELTAHELAHQWFGDYVTCNSWTHIWLNEGFASYAEYLALESLRPVNFKNNWMANTHQRIMSAPNGSVYVTDTINVLRIFDGRLSYDKGSAILHTIRYMLQEDTAFFQVLQIYLQRYANSTASAENFKAVLEEVSQKDFTAFFNEWYYGEGYPIYNVRWNHVDGMMYLNNRQTTSTAATPFFSTPVEYRIQLADGRDTLINFQPAAADETHAFPLTGEVTAVLVDPNNWIVNRDTVMHDTTLVSPVSGVNTIASKGIQVYPVPCQEVLYIHYLVNSRKEVEVYDVTGRMVQSTYLQHSQTALDTKQLKPGVYLLKITDNTGVKRSRFVKE